MAIKLFHFKLSSVSSPSLVNIQEKRLVELVEFLLNRLHSILNFNCKVFSVANEGHLSLIRLVKFFCYSLCEK